MISMVAYCNDCTVYVNQYCDKCTDNFGIGICEKYACGGLMRCPGCKGTNLSARKEFGPDPYDYQKKMREGKVTMPSKDTCSCGFKLDKAWRYCPNCGKIIS